MSEKTTTIDAAEVAKFEAMAAEWWDPEGKFKPLHHMSPCRLDYVVDQICAQYGRRRKTRQPLSGLSIVDVGCGGGLAAEPIARLGADVTGLDATDVNIGVAKAHAESVGLDINYRAEPAEDVVKRGETFDVVLALEVIEHVADVSVFLSALFDLLKPGGIVILSTLNRTAKSWAMAIAGAEHILRWLPVGTHDWAKFITPEELETALSEAGLLPIDSRGMVLDILSGTWSLSEDQSVNFIAAAEKPLA
ncbi:MAG: bifunctional 2-polyprenyl-6-hydroxyphenol methylase/3-demethylubiquinol 3-O-methyltransferase UbiG [Pikeienuella sp.]